MIRYLLVSVSALLVTLQLAGCSSSYTTTTSSMKVGTSSRSAKQYPPNQQNAPAISGSSKAPDLAAFAAYYKACGYVVKADRETFNSDGTVKSFYFNAAPPRESGQAAGNVIASIENNSSPKGRVAVVKTALPNTPPPYKSAHDALSKRQIASVGLPQLSEFATSSQINRFVDYYTQRGYVVTTNQQVYKPNGIIESFRFEAAKKMGLHHGDNTASAKIDAATHEVTNSETTGSYEVTLPPRYGFSFGGKYNYSFGK